MSKGGIQLLWNGPGDHPFRDIIKVSHLNRANVGKPYCIPAFVILFINPKSIVAYSVRNLSDVGAEGRPQPFYFQILLVVLAGNTDHLRFRPGDDFRLHGEAILKVVQHVGAKLIFVNKPERIGIFSILFRSHFEELFKGPCKGCVRFKLATQSDIED